jgi:hypothetical protein
VIWRKGGWLHSPVVKWSKKYLAHWFNLKNCFTVYILYKNSASEHQNQAEQICFQNLASEQSILGWTATKRYLFYALHMYLGVSDFYAYICIKGTYIGLWLDLCYVDMLVYTTLYTFSEYSGVLFRQLFNKRGTETDAYSGSQKAKRKKNNLIYFTGIPRLFHWRLTQAIVIFKQQKLMIFQHDFCAVL